MQPKMFSVTICFCVVLGINDYAIGETANLTSIKSEFIVDSTVDAKIRRLNKLAQSVSSNVQGVAESRQLLDDIDKIGIDLVSNEGTYTVLSTKRLELLAKLNSLQRGPCHNIATSANITTSEKKAILEIRRVRKEIANSGGILVWDGNKWADGRRLAVNNVNLPPAERMALVDLNYWEQSFGRLSVADNQNGKNVDMGETSAVISDLKTKLERSGFYVELDNILRIWKIRTDSTK